MSAFQKYKRGYCLDCERRMIVDRYAHQRGLVCVTCYRKAIEQMERDEEMRSLRGYDAEDISRFF
jgi:hypothetical protein